MPAPCRVPRRARLVALAAVAPALLAGLTACSGSNHPQPTAAPRPSTPSPRPSIVAAASTPVRPPSTPPPHRPAPPSTRPWTFTITGPKLHLTAHVCAMANIRPYDPPGEQHHTVCWVRSGFGVAPGVHQRGTSYVFGHSWAEDDQEVLNRVSAPATREMLVAQPHIVDRVPVYSIHGLDGDLIRLRTNGAPVTYQVRGAYGVAKNQLGFIRSWLDPNVPGRLLVTTCAELNGRDYEDNIILEAYVVPDPSRTSA
jgi:hypothetical protein